MSFVNPSSNNNYSNNPSYQYSENDKTQDNDLEFHLEIILLDKKDPFYGTDLLVFHDEFTGNLPVNGIKESDFIFIKEKYQEFLNGETKFEIEKDKAFTEIITDSLIKLLTREIGRKIFLRILSDQKIKSVVLERGKEAEAKYFDNRHDSSLLDDQIRYVVRINTENKKRLVSINNKGEKQSIPINSFISLGHELIHVTHASALDVFKPPTVSLRSNVKPEKNFDILEEQTTMTGLSLPIQFATENISEEILEQDFEAVEQNYNELNENALRAAFNLPPRIDHSSVREKPVDLNDHESKEFVKFFKSAIKNGLVADVKEILKTNIDLNRKFGKKYPLEYAIEAKKSQIIEILIEHGANPFQLNDKKVTLVELAFNNLISDKNNSRVKLNRFLSIIPKQINEFFVSDLKKNRAKNKILYRELVKFLKPPALQNLNGELVFRDFFKSELSWYFLDKISAILAKNNQIVDLNQVDKEGNTLLHLFLSNPNLEGDIESEEDFSVLEEILNSLSTKENLNMLNNEKMLPMDLAKKFHPKLVNKLGQLLTEKTQGSSVS